MSYSRARLGCIHHRELLSKEVSHERAALTKCTGLSARDISHFPFPETGLSSFRLGNTFTPCICFPVATWWNQHQSFPGNEAGHQVAENKQINNWSTQSVSPKITDTNEPGLLLFQESLGLWLRNQKMWLRNLLDIAPLWLYLKIMCLPCLFKIFLDNRKGLLSSCSGSKTGHIPQLLVTSLVLRDFTKLFSHSPYLCSSEPV